jgi:hypothetical protein
MEKLHCADDGLWFFSPGVSTDVRKRFFLLNFEANCHTLLDSTQLFRGYSKFQRVYQACNQVQLHSYVLRHVSAHGLTSLIAPTSLKNHLCLNDTDKKIWNDAYHEEYDGLTLLPTWEVITEDQFCQLSKGVKPLPTMAIATLKYDENNGAKCAKYCIVVLGNHYPHHWSKESTAAPVMSQLELRILTSLAI